jgi:hypothetical protein
MLPKPVKVGATLYPPFMVGATMVGAVIGFLTIERACGAPVLDWAWPSLPS